MLRAVGFTDADFDKPQVGVASSWNEVTPCNMPLDRLAKRSKEGVRAAGGFEGVWRGSQLFASLRKPDGGGACTSCGFFDACRGGCMAAKFFTGLPLDGPDPECVKGHGEPAPARVRW